MLVGQTARVGRQVHVCWLVKQVGRLAGMLAGQTTGKGRQVCWLVKQLW